MVPEALEALGPENLLALGRLWVYVLQRFDFPVFPLVLVVVLVGVPVFLKRILAIQRLIELVDFRNIFIIVLALLFQGQAPGIGYFFA